MNQKAALWGCIPVFSFDARIVAREPGDRTSSEPGDYLAHRWPAVAQVFQKERGITRNHHTTTELSFDLTSLPVQVTPAPQLLRLVRDY